ncbi:hypothetical protein K474DRAFT_1655881 [Panus rudis PR-1116 ss-1]|nr:hypothetical protein K474DRAFT_1655881 [Panus rudis PR-1116 ss-1]
MSIGGRFTIPPQATRILILIFGSRKHAGLKNAIRKVRSFLTSYMNVFGYLDLVLVTVGGSAAGTYLLRVRFLEPMSCG